MFLIKRHINPILFLLSVTICWGNSLFAQDKKQELEINKKKIEEEIRYNSKLLNETRKTKKTTLNQLVILKNEIKQREKLIDNINSQIKTTNEQIRINNEIINELKNDLENLRIEYAQMIYYAYKNRNSFDRMMYIFAASDFNQAFRRLKYFQQYADYRETQAELIIKTQEEISLSNSQLDQQKQEKLELLVSLKEERDHLSSARNEQNLTYSTLSRKEKELAKTIKEKERAAEILQEEIEKIIAEEIRIASEKSGTTETGTFALTPDEMELSAGFENNKGRLPWPVEKGIISSTFGEHSHPVLKQVKTKNNGINILTENESKARAVFGGEVTRVMSIPGYNYVVMIRHGQYLSVYSNLSEVYVSKGSKVNTRQEIGKIYTDMQESKTEMHFELWKGKTLLNPVGWLARD